MKQSNTGVVEKKIKQDKNKATAMAGNNNNKNRTQVAIFFIVPLSFLSYLQ